MFSLRKIYTFIFLVGVFFIPFNEFKGLSFLGEYSNEAAAYFFIVGFLVLIVEQIVLKKIIFPLRYVPIFLFAVYISWTIISSLINLPGLLDSNLKGTGGVNRFIRQLISLLLCSSVFLYFYINVLRKKSVKEIFLFIRKILLISFAVVFSYGFLEVVYSKVGIGAVKPIMQLYGFLPFFDITSYYNDRISSVSFEAPFLAIYLITVAGWMFSYILTEKHVFKYIPAFCILFLTYFSGSRTALIIVTFQIFLFALVLMRQKKYRRYMVYFGGVAVIGVAVFLSTARQGVLKDISEKVDSLDFKKNLLENVSNRSRFGMQVAQWEVFKEHPIIGVGLGQQAYYSRFHYPAWAVTDNYEFRLWYKNPNVKNFPPGYNLYVRILAEHGLVGIFLFLSFVAVCIWEAIKIFNSKNKEHSILGMVLALTLIGLSINWLQSDTYRFYGFWLSLAILYSAKRIIDKEAAATKINS